MGGGLLGAIGGLGGLYALCGVAVWLGLRLTGVVNLGLAGCAGLSALVLASGVLASGAGLAAVLAAVLVGGVIGAAAAGGLELAVMRRVGGGAPVVVAGLAAWLVLDGLSGAVWGLSGATPVQPVVSIAWVVALLLVVVAGVAWMDRRGRFGLALRATAADPVAAVLGGVDVPMLRLAVAAAAGGLVGSASVLAGLLAAGPGWLLVLHGVAAALLGRRFGLAGVVGAGLALAAMEWLAGAGDLLGYVALVAALLVPSRAAARPA